LRIERGREKDLEARDRKDLEEKESERKGKEKTRECE
jgi:hypothetical protein